MPTENSRQPLIGSPSKLITIVLLLLLQFALRTHNVTAQAAFLDEGLHNQRASIAWHLDANPGQNSQGKLLLYYWLGLFVGSPLTALQVSRTAIALVSLLSGATIYLLGRYLHSHLVGIVALLLYAILPLVVFHERMALADPLAAVFSCLIAWRSLVLARHPRLRNGVTLGFLLALGTMAKLNLFMLPLLPVALSFLYMPSGHSSPLSAARQWLRMYLGPLIIAALVVLILWAPILVPAYIVRNSPTAFKLIDPQTIANSDGSEGSGAIIEYATSFVQRAFEFVGPGTLAWFAFCIVYLLTIGSRRGAMLEATFFVLAWLIFLVFPLIAFATFPTPRYAAPEGAPLVLISALTGVSLWNMPRLKLVARPFVVGLMAIWMAAFALPFDYTAATSPDQLPLGRQNQVLYFHQGITVADASVQHAINWLNTMQNDPTPVYSEWRLCALIYFYSPYPLHCLDRDKDTIPLATQLASIIKPGQSAYLVDSGFDPDWPAAPNLCPTLEQRQNRGPDLTLDIWRVRSGPCLLLYVDGAS